MWTVFSTWLFLMVFICGLFGIPLLFEWLDKRNREQKDEKNTAKN